MKTKNIFKTLAAAMLMHTMLLTTACSNDDEIVNTENPANAKGYTLPVTVNVTRQGDDATTRATYTYDEDTKKGTLSFSTGDKLFVSGSYNESNYSFAGMLDYVSDGKFSGTIYTESEYTGTAEELLSSATDPEDFPEALLIPAGYESYEYLELEEIAPTAGYYQDKTNAFALTKAAAVEQFSFELAETYSAGFTLSPQNAIVSFTISGLTANKEVAVSFNPIEYVVISKSVTTSAEGVATFAIGLDAGTQLGTLTVDGNNIAMPTKTVEAGHIYNISRSVTPAGPTAYTLAESTVGMIVGSDGKAYAAADKDNLPTGVTAVAMVAYKSGSNGLAIQLNDDPVKMNWADAKTNAEGLTAVSGGTWHLPSKDDWQNMFVGCAVSGDATVPDANDEMDPIAGFKAKIAATGITWKSSNYWSSTESSSPLARLVRVKLDDGDAVAAFSQSPTFLPMAVLGCLAF